MGFLGVYKAIYDYVPQGESELQITEGDILYVLEKSGEDDWWKAKKKASGTDDDEPVGLIPNNYIEEVCISHMVVHGIYIKSKALPLQICEYQNTKHGYN